MVKEDYERKLTALRNAISGVHASIRQGNYAAAFDNIQLVKDMIPNKYNGPLETAYREAKGEIGLLTRAALEGAESRISSGYRRVNAEMGRISRGGSPTPNARRTVKAMENLVNYLTDAGMPEEISEEFKPHKARVEKLKKQLEAFATSRGGTIDWTKP